MPPMLEAPRELVDRDQLPPWDEPPKALPDRLLLGATSRLPTRLPLSIPPRSKLPLLPACREAPPYLFAVALSR